MLLEDKVVCVSGAGPGLGYQLIAAALREGASVEFSARTPGRREALHQRLAQDFPGALWRGHVADLTDALACTDLAARILEHHGRLDVLIANAFKPAAASAFREAVMDDWREAMEVNFFGNMHLLGAMQAFLEASGGTLIVINSMNTRQVAPGRAGNAASKAALLVATQYLARELAPLGVRVSSVLPGWMWGPAVEDYLRSREGNRDLPAEDLREQLAAELQLPRVPSDEDCALATIALASDYFVAAHGACLDINGGAHIGLT